MLKSGSAPGFTAQEPDIYCKSAAGLLAALRPTILMCPVCLLASLVHLEGHGHSVAARSSGVVGIARCCSTSDMACTVCQSGQTSVSALGLYPCSTTQAVPLAL